MLSKHIEKVRGKSEDYRKFYSLAASFLFTGVVASFWMFSWFIPAFSAVDNSASVANAVDVVSPTGMVKQEAGNVFNSLADSVKKAADGAGENSTPISPPSNSITKGGITVEAESPAVGGDNNLDNNLATSSTQDGSVDNGYGSVGSDGSDGNSSGN